MRRFPRYSIAAILFVTFCVALVMRWAASPNVVREGVKEWTEFCFVPYSVGIVDEAYPNDRWAPSSLTYGEGTYCHIEEGGHVLNSTGAWYFSLGIQLPYPLVEGYSTELRSISSLPDGDVRKLKTGEIVAMEFGNPSVWRLASGVESSLGSLTVLEVDKQFIRILLTAKIPMKGTILTQDERVLDLDREFRLDHTLMQNPIELLPRKSQITYKE